LEEVLYYESDLNYSLEPEYGMNQITYSAAVCWHPMSENNLLFHFSFLSAYKGFKRFYCTTTRTQRTVAEPRRLASTCDRMCCNTASRLEV